MVEDSEPVVVEVSVIFHQVNCYMGHLVRVQV